MKKYIVSLCVLFAFASVIAQRVSNVQFEQVGKQVEVTYSLDKQADISLYVSTDGGRTYSAPLRAVSGDVGKNISAGYKKLLWSPLDEMEQLVSNQVVFKVVPSGKTLTFTVGGVSFKMQMVEGGSFTMGCTSEQGGDCESDESPSHQVTLSDYYIGQTEVTQGLWRAVMGSNPSSFIKGDNYPVEDVSWNDCQDFIRKLNNMLSSELGGKRFSLPTEAQWEYAARGGKKSGHYKYAGSNNIGSVTWYGGHSGSRTHPVGQKVANELGLYDMSGNVYEWCQDWYGSYTGVSQTNPTGAASGSVRVLRGGSWITNEGSCRVSGRYKSPPDFRDGIRGLRLVLVP